MKADRATPPTYLGSVNDRAQRYLRSLPKGAVVSTDRLIEVLQVDRNALLSSTSVARERGQIATRRRGKYLFWGAADEAIKGLEVTEIEPELIVL